MDAAITTSFVGLAGALTGGFLGWLGAIQSARIAFDLQEKKLLNNMISSLSAEIKYIKQSLESDTKELSNSNLIPYLKGNGPMDIDIIFCSASLHIGKFKCSDECAGYYC